MRTRWIKVRPLTVAAQVYHMRASFPQFTATTNRGNWVRWLGTLQPTAMSDRYSIEMAYKIPYRPEVRVLSPELRLHPKYSVLPHVFEGNRLCVHTADEWNGQSIIAHTIVPWVCAWLYFYEVWLATGLWLGEGAHAEFPQHRSASNEIQPQCEAADWVIHT